MTTERRFGKADTIRFRPATESEYPATPFQAESYNLTTHALAVACTLVARPEHLP